MSVSFDISQPDTGSKYTTKLVIGNVDGMYTVHLRLMISASVVGGDGRQHGSFRLKVLRPCKLQSCNWKLKAHWLALRSTFVAERLFVLFVLF